EILAKVERIKNICDRYSVSIKAAALHFALAHPAAAAVISGGSKPARIPEDQAALKETIPDDFWHEVRKQQLVSADAPLPVDQRKKQARAVASVDISGVGGFCSVYLTNEPEQAFSSEHAARWWLCSKWVGFFGGAKRSTCSKARGGYEDYNQNSEARRQERYARQRDCGENQPTMRHCCDRKELDYRVP